MFSIFYLHVANLLIHSYALKRSIGEEENEYKDSFLDILSILFDKEEQQDDEWKIGAKKREMRWE